MRITFILLLLAVARTVTAQVVEIVEAEACKVTRADNKPSEILPTEWASGGKKLGGLWGEQKGDAVEWKLELKRAEPQLKLAIRYSFDQAMHARIVGKHDTDRKLKLTIDDAAQVDVELPDTKSWDDFDSVYVALPKLTIGSHALKLTSPYDHLTTDLDAFTFFRGDEQKVLTPARRSAVVIRSDDKRFVVRMTPRAAVKQSPEQIVKDFNRIYDYFKDYMGWEPDRTPINLHIYEKALGKGTFEAEFGLYFEDWNFSVDRGNWVHEMNHMFDNGLFPDWTGHPMIRVNDTFVTRPQIFPEVWESAAKDPNWEARLAAGKKVLANPKYETDDPHEILYALHAKYGKDLLRRFYKECREAKDRSEITFVRGKGLTCDEYVKLLSKAAGEDVLHFFQQWKGFKDAK